MIRLNTIALLSVIATATLLVSGCRQIGGRAFQLSGGKTPAFVIPPGTKVKVGDKQAMLYGVQTCPSTSPFDAPRLEAHRCVVINSSQTSVPLILHYLQPESKSSITSQEKVEMWAVVRNSADPGFFRLRRTDGTFVQPQ